MTLIEKIRADQLDARKALRNETVTSRVRADLLTTLIGEAEAVGKNEGRAPTDAEVVAMIKKFLKSARETMVALVKSNSPCTQINEVDRTIEILEEYLPSQMSEQDLADFFNSCSIAEPALNMGGAMALLKQRRPGLYDGKMASTVARAIFS